MARLLTAGAESQANSTEGISSAVGAVTYDTGTVRSGATSWKFDSTVSNAQTFQTFTTGTLVLGRTYFARGYFRFASLPTADTNLISCAGVSGASILVTFFAANSSLQLWAGGTIGFSSPLTTNVWYRVELSWKIDTGSVDSCELVVDGVQAAATTGAAISDSVTVPGVIMGMVGAPGASVVMYLDDVAINDSTAGGTQTSYPGAANVVLLKPTADSAIGTGWVGGAGGTSSEFDAMNNTPPVGVADTGTNASQNRNATAAANSNLDMTMTTYTAAGVPTGATINVVDPIVATGAPVVTSAKAGTVGVVSNPAITNVNLAAGGTAGAFWSGTTAGTYPTGWKISHSTTTYAPSVTLGTAPVMRLTQVTSSTRIAMVCFMGIYVDYTPAVVANPPPPGRNYPQILAQ